MQCRVPRWEQAWTDQGTGPRRSLGTTFGSYRKPYCGQAREIRILAGRLLWAKATASKPSPTCSSTASKFEIVGSVTEPQISGFVYIPAVTEYPSERHLEMQRDHMRQTPSPVSPVVKHLIP